MSGVRETLAKIADLTPAEKGAWDRDEVMRLAVERLWILAGNAAEEHRKSRGIGKGAGPWSELWAFRVILAHAVPGAVDSDRVWFETTVDLPRLRAEVE